ncbi:MAG: glycine oxidase [Hyphomicrobiales bacterium]
MSDVTSPRIAIIGAGVIGLSIGWRLAQRGAAVTIFERGAAGQGASHAAAGMLAACAEVEPGEERLFALNRQSQALWPAFAAELEAASGMAVDLRREGTLVVALNADDRARLLHHLEFQHQLGLTLDWLTGAEVKRREPHLSPSVIGALASPQDHQVDNRKVAGALRIAVERASAVLHEYAPIARIIIEHGRAVGVMVRDKLHRADTVVLAAGAWSRAIEGLPAEARPPVRPVKGQMLSLRMDARAPLLRHVVWAPDVYLVPRHDGRLLVGATVEEKGFDPHLTAGGQLTLLNAAWRALPGIEDLPLEESWVGFRPGSRDDAPILGRGAVEGLVYATGHHRNGILLTPITAQTIAGLILDSETDPVIAPFALDRFTPAVAAE